MGQLTIDLFEPGMTPLHRAGLGGLACTLAYYQRSKDRPAVDLSRCHFDDRRVTLEWPDDVSDAAFFQGLYEASFQVRDGLLHLPGAYGQPGVGTPPEVCAALQQGMSATILQFGPNRKTRSKTLKTVTYEIDDKPLSFDYQDLESYTHSKAWKDLVNTKGKLNGRVQISGTVAPGFAQRHVVHSETFIEQPPGHAVALHFALVGTISYTLGRKGGVLLIPDVADLKSFVNRRKGLNPKNGRECHVASVADAALQAQVRVRQGVAAVDVNVDRIYAILFASQSWNEKQKTRAEVIEVERNDSSLDMYEEVLAIEELRPRVAEAKPEKKGDPPRPFVVGGVVRPLIAENLAAGKPWYQGFRSLLVSYESTQQECAHNLSFETKGLIKLINKWVDTGEKQLIESIHEAMRARFSDLINENQDPVTRNNRIKRQKQQWRLQFANAKTQADVMRGLASLWSKSEQTNQTLRDSWADLLPLICDPDRWELMRDLVLVALSSYASAERTEPSEVTTH